ncbi:MAG: hypothetical protein JWP75_3740 [Frondihabitans sp.]|nr:hypothetical protein [Frondihabitans sp.]
MTIAFEVGEPFDPTPAPAGEAAAATPTHLPSLEIDDYLDDTAEG